MCLGNGYFATDKTPFISEKSPKAISGYIIGSLKVQRCINNWIIKKNSMHGYHMRFSKILVTDIFMEAKNEELIKRKNNDDEKHIAGNKSYCIFDGKNK